MSNKHPSGLSLSLSDEGDEDHIPLSLCLQVFSEKFHDFAEFHWDYVTFLTPLRGFIVSFKQARYVFSLLVSVSKPLMNQLIWARCVACCFNFF